MSHAPSSSHTHTTPSSLHQHTTIQATHLLKSLVTLVSQVHSHCEKRHRGKRIATFPRHECSSPTPSLEQRKCTAFALIPVVGTFVCTYTEREGTCVLPIDVKTLGKGRNNSICCSFWLCILHLLDDQISLIVKPHSKHCCCTTQASRISEVSTSAIHRHHASVRSALRTPGSAPGSCKGCCGRRATQGAPAIQT